MLKPEQIGFEKVAFRVVRDRARQFTYVVRPAVDDVLRVYTKRRKKDKKEK